MVDRDTQAPTKAQDNNHVRQELVIGLVGLVGTDLMAVVRELEKAFKKAEHEVNTVSITQDVFPKLFPELNNKTFKDEFERISELMTYGNRARSNSKDKSILALGAISRIYEKRSFVDDTDESKPLSKTIHIIKSLKHPSEVERLREIYGEGFFLIGVHTEEKSRIGSLTKNDMTSDQAKKLVDRDYKENKKHGQHTSDTFHLADLFVYLDSSDTRSRLETSISRFTEILLSHPNHSPDFDEFAMYMAFASSLCSADPSRQIGAVIGLSGDIIATGANDCPAPGGGLYMTHHNEDNGEYYVNKDRGRDCTLGHETDPGIVGYDSNMKIKNEIIDGLVRSISPLCNGSEDKLRKILSASKIKDITEYGRAVHAEMAALTSCARKGISCEGATLYTTTFPCHNCAKHIITAGIKKVVYIEPYDKSKAIDLHSDAIDTGRNTDKSKVQFERFIGFGPRRFFDLFSMRHGMGGELIRKDGDGNVPKWTPQSKTLRFGLTPASYLERETIATNIFETFSV